MTLTTERATLSVEEAAHYIGLSRSKTWELIARGDLPSFTVGRRRLLSVERLQDWIRQQEASDEAA
jgi:excisionase family DNA binding protein